MQRTMSSKPYSGKVLENVQRNKTPHEIWLEKKQSQNSSTCQSTSRSTINDTINQTAELEPDFTQVQLKKKDANNATTKRFDPNV